MVRGNNFWRTWVPSLEDTWEEVNSVEGTSVMEAQVVLVNRQAFHHHSLTCLLPAPASNLLPSPVFFQGGHHTLPSPLLFNAQYLIRLQFPLGYNFMRILRYAGTERERELHSPAFQNLMNDMSTVPVLGTGFNVYAPMVLVVLCMFTFFKVGLMRFLDRSLCW